MAKSRGRLRTELGRLLAERRHLLRRMGRDDELAVGTVSTVSLKCGKPNCHCVDGPGHVHTRFLFIDETGHRRCKLVRRTDEKRVLRAGERYRQFRQDLKRLRTIDSREKEILVALRDRRALRYE